MRCSYKNTIKRTRNSEEGKIISTFKSRVREQKAKQSSKEEVLLRAAWRVVGFSLWETELGHPGAGKNGAQEPRWGTEDVFEKIMDHRVCLLDSSCRSRFTILFVIQSKYTVYTSINS